MNRITPHLATWEVDRGNDWKFWERSVLTLSGDRAQWTVGLLTTRLTTFTSAVVEAQIGWAPVTEGPAVALHLGWLDDGDAIKGATDAVALPPQRRKPPPSRGAGLGRREIRREGS